MTTHSPTLTYLFCSLSKTGVEAVKQLRQDGYSCFIIGLTGASFEDEISEFLAAGVDLVLGKPFTAGYMKALMAHFRLHGNVSRPNIKWREEYGRIVLQAPSDTN